MKIDIIRLIINPRPKDIKTSLVVVSRWLKKLWLLIRLIKVLIILLGLEKIKLLIILYLLKNSQVSKNTTIIIIWTRRIRRLSLLIFFR